MELWQLILISLVILAVVVGGYTFMFFHIMRRDPRELEFRKKMGQDDRLIPHKYKSEIKKKKKESN